MHQDVVMRKTTNERAKCLTTNICLALTMTPFLLFLLWIWSRQCATTSAVQSKKSPLLPIQIWTEATLQLYLEAVYDGNGIIN